MQKNSTQTIAIIGGGFAGLHLYQLLATVRQTVLFEAKPNILSGNSGQKMLMAHPLLTRHATPTSRWTDTAIAWMRRRYSSSIRPQAILQLCHHPHLVERYRYGAQRVPAATFLSSELLESKLGIRACCGIYFHENSFLLTEADAQRMFTKEVRAHGNDNGNDNGNGKGSQSEVPTHGIQTNRRIALLEFSKGAWHLFDADGNLLGRCTTVILADGGVSPFSNSGSKDGLAKRVTERMAIRYQGKEFFVDDVFRFRLLSGQYFVLDLPLEDVAGTSAAHSILQQIPLARSAATVANQARQAAASKGKGTIEMKQVASAIQNSHLVISGSLSIIPYADDDANAAAAADANANANAAAASDSTADGTVESDADSHASSKPSKVSKVGKLLIGSIYHHIPHGTSADLSQGAADDFSQRSSHNMSKEKNATIVERLKQHFPRLASVPTARILQDAKSYGGYRCSTPDYLPLVGEWLPGLYLSIGHGSRGMPSSALAAEMIAQQILGEDADAKLDLQLALELDSQLELARVLDLARDARLEQVSDLKNDRDGNTRDLRKLSELVSPSRYC